ncbi:uncharacterized protein EMH_0016360 [Eimeria mitis]|uniref:Mediator of RNA polymerase II transcription subunit 21 n=1 Tax=Eimeria mitis TaxID=44415 RepID=U6JZ11_9EIME|nr:uncharacterized protein EMH_0016360 [Eimeria mitis]CDJ28758.1 hypothetical protein, conserved [Eimeria mitis]
MQPPLGGPPQLQAPPARDPVTKLQILLGNLLKHFTDVVVHLSDVAPPRSVSGAVDVDGASEAAEGSSSGVRTAMTEEQLNEFILSCSKGVGNLVHVIEEEAEKLPDAIQSQEEVESELRYLERENEVAAAELKQLVASVRLVREAIREAYRDAATDGTRITID